MSLSNLKDDGRSLRHDSSRCSNMRVDDSSMLVFLISLLLLLKMASTQVPNTLANRMTLNAWSLTLPTRDSCVLLKVMRLISVPSDDEEDGKAHSTS
ncbi:hypothetical protein OGAPHI_005676 [Ogataea philodendri]|uniref:Uncharacterized protein n=1 Tax=Ogataea philodendri TaxID=1378263 RepID=A0A9P8NZP4_9ASCO|nr:uncharacterized protein OGAPHI_005676 [Ogataea philodendri]KAH3662424.1 hypothetical protein OGAPHI_005676 [Ogataea philodendri]